MACPPKTSEPSFVPPKSITPNDHHTTKDWGHQNDRVCPVSHFMEVNTEQYNGNVQVGDEFAFCNSISQNGKTSKCVEGDLDICVHHSCRHTVTKSKHREKINGLNHVGAVHSCDKKLVGNKIEIENEESAQVGNENCSKNSNKVLETKCRCNERDSGMSCDDIAPLEKECSCEACCSSEEKCDMGVIEDKLKKTSLHQQQCSNEACITSADVICGKLEETFSHQESCYDTIPTTSDKVICGDTLGETSLHPESFHDVVPAASDNVMHPDKVSCGDTLGDTSLHEESCSDTARAASGNVIFGDTLGEMSIHPESSYDAVPTTSDDVMCGVTYRVYESEKQMPDIMRLITKDLSEPYSIYTYRYFIHNWPKLCFLAIADEKCVGAIVCKLDVHKKMVRRGYIAMLAVDSEYRRRKIGSTLVTKAIEAMIRSDCDEVVLETEITNQAALCLYENLGFIRDKRLFRYYLNGVDALRLKLWLR